MNGSSIAAMHGIRGRDTMQVEGRGVEPLTGPDPETASGTTRPPRTTAAVTSGRCLLANLGNGGPLQRWRHLAFSKTEWRFSGDRLRLGSLHSDQSKCVWRRASEDFSATNISRQCSAKPCALISRVSFSERGKQLSQVHRPSSGANRIARLCQCAVGPKHWLDAAAVTSLFGNHFEGVFQGLQIFARQAELGLKVGYFGSFPLDLPPQVLSKSHALDCSMDWKDWIEC